MTEYISVDSPSIKSNHANIILGNVLPFSLVNLHSPLYGVSGTRLQSVISANICISPQCEAKTLPQALESIFVQPLQLRTLVYSLLISTLTTAVNLWLPPTEVLLIAT